MKLNLGVGAYRTEVRSLLVTLLLLDSYVLLGIEKTLDPSSVDPDLL